MAEIFDYINPDQLVEALSGKSDIDHLHAQYQTQAQTDGRYYQKGEVDTALDGKASARHLHDDRYYLKTDLDIVFGDITTSLDGKANAVHPHALTSLSDMSETAPVDGQVPRWDAASGKWAYSFEVAAVADGSVNLGGNGGTSSERIYSLTSPSAEWYYQPYFVGLQSLTNGAGLPNDLGSVIGSDGLLAFVETDLNKIAGYVEMNLNTFRMFGPIYGTALYEDDVALSAKYLGIEANAVSASKLATARTITLTGGASGAVEFDGSGNVEIPVTITNDSHTLTMANVTGLNDALTQITDDTTDALTQITDDTAAALATKLDKAGGTLTGALEMGEQRVQSEVAPGTLFYYQPVRNNLAAMANSAGLVGSEFGSVIGSDGVLVFAETDGDYVIGFMDMNAFNFRWYGTLNANTIRENNQLLSDKYLGKTANATTASKLATPRTISLSGDASGSASFDGSGNINIAVEVGALYGNRITAAANSAALAGQSVAVNCTAGPVTITAPMAPAENDIFEVGDAWSASETNNITVDFGAETFAGAAEDFIIDLNGYVAKFRFLGGTWRLWHG